MKIDVTRYPHPGLEKTAAVSDFMVIALSGPASSVIYQLWSGEKASTSLYLGISLLISGSFISSQIYRGIYSVELLLSLDKQVRSAFFHLTVWFGVMLAVTYLMKPSSDISRGAASVFYGLSGFGLLVSRICWSQFLQAELQRGTLVRRSVALLSWGSVEYTASVRRRLESRGFQIAQQVSILDQGEKAASDGVSSLLGIVRGSQIEEILISLPYTMLGSLPELVEQLRSTPLPARVVPDDHLSYILFQRRRGFGSFGLVEVKREPLSGFERAVKRALDLFVAGAAIVALAPLLCASLIALKLDSKGPVLFKQTRQGFNGRTFKILKLRTMHVLEDGPLIAQTARDDRRVTRVGRWLRRTSIDELPQLWNVVRGDMSIVGPRPHAVAHDEYYDELIENYAFRQHVKPGLTGWAQANGFRGETPRVEDMKARVEMDLWYINNWSVGLDLRIISLTCTRLISKEAY